MKRQKVKWFGFLQFTVAELVFINFEVLSPEFYFVNSFRKAIFIIQNLKLLELFMLEYSSDVYCSFSSIHFFPLKML